MKKGAPTPGLYATNAMPNHYVHVDGDGDQWLIPVSAMHASAALDKTRPYNGNQVLHRVPDYLARFYGVRYPVGE